MPRLIKCQAIDVPDGVTFRWRSSTRSPWQEYTVVSWDEANQQLLCRCKHGNVDQFNPYSQVEYDAE